MEPSRKKTSVQDKIKDLERKLSAEQQELERRKRKINATYRELMEITKKKIANYKNIRGGIVHIAGLLYVNPEVLLGALLKEVLPVISEGQMEKIREWQDLGAKYYALPYKSKEREEFRDQNEVTVDASIQQNPVLADKDIR